MSFSVSISISHLAASFHISFCSISLSDQPSLFKPWHTPPHSPLRIPLSDSLKITSLARQTKFLWEKKNPAVISANCIPQGIHTQSTFHSDYIYEAIVELSSAATDIEQLFYPHKKSPLAAWSLGCKDINWCRHTVFVSSEHIRRSLTGIVKTLF